MPKVFNTAAICIPQEHYMVNLDSRVREDTESFQRKWKNLWRT